MKEVHRHNEDELANYQTHLNITTPILPCKRLTKTATLPTKGSKYAAGFDLYADIPGPIILQPGQRQMISTGISVAIPRTWYGRVAPRSGLALNSGLNVLAGVIDSDFLGEVKVILINHGMIYYEINHKDRIAQLILEKCGNFQIEEVNSLDKTERGSGGFGSTGK